MFIYPTPALVVLVLLSLVLVISNISSSIPNMLFITIVFAVCRACVEDVPCSGFRILSDADGRQTVIYIYIYIYIHIYIYIYIHIMYTSIYIYI